MKLVIQSMSRVWGGNEKWLCIVGDGDIFVLSSRNEGMANVMLKAMAAATPVIGADVSGVRLALRDKAQAAIFGTKPLRTPGTI